MKALLVLLIVVVGIDTWATLAYDDVSCLMADHQWLTLAGVSLLSTTIGGATARHRLSKGKA